MIAGTTIGLQQQAFCKKNAFLTMERPVHKICRK